MSVFEKSWKLKTMGTDGNVRLFGVNIFDYEWINTGEKAEVQNLYRDISVYEVKIRNKVRRFAAEEVSNCVWKFYLYKI